MVRGRRATASFCSNLAPQFVGDWWARFRIVEARVSVNTGVAPDQWLNPEALGPSLSPREGCATRSHEMRSLTRCDPFMRESFARRGQSPSCRCLFNRSSESDARCLKRFAALCKAELISCFVEHMRHNKP